MDIKEIIELVADRSGHWEHLTPTAIHPLQAERIVGVPPEWSWCSYRRTLMLCHINITKQYSPKIELYFTSVIFISIDDGDIPLIGPHESLEKATRRYDHVLKEMEDMIWVPPEQELRDICKRTGLYLNL